MERVVVVFDILNPVNGMTVRMTKLWNTAESASAYINEYTDRRSDLTWKYNDNSDPAFKEMSPGAVVEFYGYSDPMKCDDMITVYHVEAEDPEEDPYKRIIRDVVSKYDNENKDDIPEDEAPHLEYAIEMFRMLLDKIDRQEEENRNKLISDQEDAHE